jgi:isochorismate hydrolase
MESELLLDVAHTALVAMDCQAGILSIYAKPQEEFIERASHVLTAARNAGMPVIDVQVGFRPGLPEVSSRNKLFATIKSSLEHQKLFQGTAGAIHPTLGPKPGDIVVTKHRVSAFTGTDFEMLLRAREIDTIVSYSASRPAASFYRRCCRPAMLTIKCRGLLHGPGCGASQNVAQPTIHATRTSCYIS